MNRRDVTLARLEEELALLKAAIKPELAGKDVRDWVDLHAPEDMLAGTCPYMNPWIPEKEQKHKKKKKDS
jgi:hypothetical protein